jgi:hypothetical protein
MVALRAETGLPNLTHPIPGEIVRTGGNARTIFPWGGLLRHRPVVGDRPVGVPSRFLRGVPSRRTPWWKAPSMPGVGMSGNSTPTVGWVAASVRFTILRLNCLSPMSAPGRECPAGTSQGREPHANWAFRTDFCDGDYSPNSTTNRDNTATARSCGAVEHCPGKIFRLLAGYQKTTAGASQGARHYPGRDR